VLIPIVGRVFRQLPLLNYFDDTKFPLDSNCFKKATSRIVLYNGWQYRDFTLLKKHQVKVREVVDYKRRPTVFPKSVFPIGVHLRRGDYRTWSNGKFFYSDESYMRLALEAVECVNLNDRRPVLVPVSNEAITWANTVCGIQVFSRQSHSAEEDFDILTHCELILGPPSTFSRAASFVGDKLMYIILEENEKFDANKVKRYVDM
jgi:hypothetical protein